MNYEKERLKKPEDTLTREELIEQIDENFYKSARRSIDTIKSRNVGVRSDLDQKSTQQE